MTARSTSLPPRPEVLLLDAGNTLVFLDGAVVADVARRRDIPLEADDVERAEAAAKREYVAFMKTRPHHDDAWFHFMETLVRVAGAPAERVGDLVRAIRAVHDEHNVWRRVPRGVPEALDRLRGAGVRLGVVSNSEGRVAEILGRVGLAGRLEVVVDSGIEGISKPDPEIFRRACARMHVAVGDAVYAGDLPEVDVLGARSAGLDAVLVDAFDDYEGYADAARVRSVVELADEWLGP